VTESPINDRIHSELLALQQLAAADIAFYKQQQWHIVNHALVVDAALVVVPTLTNGLGTLGLLFLWAIALIILTAGLHLVSEMGVPLAQGRNRLAELRKHFDYEISLRAYAAGDDPQVALQRANEKISLERFFKLILIVGFILTAWLVMELAYA
jgi:hypothetical protein